MNSKIEDVIFVFDELLDDSTVPKNIKAKISEMKQIVENDADNSIKINRILDDLEELSNDNNTPSYVRTQLWNIVSILESI